MSLRNKYKISRLTRTVNNILTGLGKYSTIVFNKVSGSGIKIDTDNPNFGWADITSEIRPDTNRPDSPLAAEFLSGLTQYHFASGKKADFVFHVPHDYAPGTDVFIHVHWGHNGTIDTGTNNMTLNYAFGKRQLSGGYVFTGVKSQPVAPAVSAATHPQNCHVVDEVQLTDATGSGNHLLTSDIEVDGLILVNFTQGACATITGGESNPFVFTIDLHYQSTGINTKNKDPDFYT